MSDLWRRCLERLEGDLSAEDLHTWLMPLQARDEADGLQLFAPNCYTLDTVRQRYLTQIEQVLQQLAGKPCPVRLEVGSSAPRAASAKPATAAAVKPAAVPARAFHHNLDPHYTFETFVEGKSNQLGKAAAMQVATNPGRAYNPLLLYGGTGLGKTHLMHAAGNLMLEHNPEFKVMCLNSEQFVGSMIEALRAKSMDEFKRRFRSVDALLIDDIQFFAGKDTTQEEFFHTFNALFESKQQIILTCDRYPKEVDKLEPRLKSRLGWGLSVAIEPPDFETRAAILLAKAHDKNVTYAIWRVRSTPWRRGQTSTASRSPPISPRKPCATCWPRTRRQSPSPISRRSPQSTSTCVCRTCCPNAGCAHWPGRGRSR